MLIRPSGSTDSTSECNDQSAPLSRFRCAPADEYSLSDGHGEPAARVEDGGLHERLVAEDRLGVDLEQVPVAGPHRSVEPERMRGAHAHHWLRGEEVMGRPG